MEAADWSTVAVTLRQVQSPLRSEVATLVPALLSHSLSGAANDQVATILQLLHRLFPVELDRSLSEALEVESRF